MLTKLLSGRQCIFLFEAITQIKKKNDFGIINLKKKKQRKEKKQKKNNLLNCCAGQLLSG